MERIGIDIGRVLIGPTLDGKEDTRFLGRSLDQAMETPPAPGSFDVVARLVAAHDAAVWLVSKCGPNVERKTRAWLAHHRFFDQTGMPESHLRFCRERPEKAIHAAELGLTVFIDDRLDVLVHLRDPGRRLLWFGDQKSPAPGWVEPVADWAAVESAFFGAI